MNHSIKHVYCVLLITLTLGACGFHLRGSQPGVKSEIASLYIQTGSAGRTANEIREQLQGSDTKITDTMSEAEFVLGLDRERIERSVLSVSAATGKAEEYKLTLTVEITVAKSGVEELLASETVRLSRDYTFDEDAVLGKFAEEELLEEELINQAAGQIIRRLNALSKK